MTTNADELNPSNPDESSLESLGRQAKAAAKRGAETAWELGRCLILAKTKCKAEGVQWEQWCNTWIPELNERTRQRYQRVGKLDHDTVKGKTKAEIYALLFGKNYGGKKDKKAELQKKLDKLTDETITLAALTADIEADPVSLRVFLSEVLNTM
jgi:hypothetical protein